MSRVKGASGSIGIQKISAASVLYLLPGHRMGQKETAVAESPTSNMEEQGRMTGGSSGVTMASELLQSPHTITCRQKVE